MSVSRRRSRGVFAACLLLATSPLHGQVQGNQDVTGPYEVVEGWLGPMPWHEEGRTFGLIAAACPETTDRIFVLQGGDLPGPRPEGRPGPRSNADHEPRRFVRPHKVTMNPYDPERHVWIVDDWENQAFRFTNHGPELVLTLGEQEVIGDGPDHFGRPTDMAAFPGRTCLVNDGYVNARVVKSNGEGEYRTEWGRGATGPGAFNRVHSVKVAADRRVYVADRRNGRIQNSASPEFCSTCGGGMAQPSHLLVTQDETVWMSDPTLNRRPQYNLNGMLLTYRGAAGSFAGAVSNPHHIDEDPDGNVAVADYANDRLQKIVPTAGGDPRRLIQPAFASMHGAAR